MNDTEENDEQKSIGHAGENTSRKSKASLSSQGQSQTRKTDTFYMTANRTFQNDTINTEMIYYIGVLQDILPSISSHSNRRKLVPWIKKLFSPEFQVDRLRKKRNKYLLHLVLVAFNDKLFSIFKESPQLGGTPELQFLRSYEPFHEARWEKDKYWEEVLYGVMEEENIMKCWFHEYCSENEDGGKSHAIAGSLLDEEFKFFLYLARPLLSLMADAEDKSTAALWILTLAKVTSCSCLTMKAVRNDYMQALLGYLQDLRLAGPFCIKPPDNGQTLHPLRHLVQNMSICNTQNNIIDPSSEEAEEFLSEQPIPETGAFCYIAITGNAKAPEKVSTVPVSTTKYNTYFGI